jgi:hypothetical protein
MSERWRDTYDQWKCATPPEHEGDDGFEDYEWEDDEDFDEAMDHCHGHFDEPGPGGLFQCGASGSEDCDECPMHRWLGLTNRQIDRLEESDDE